MSAITEVTSTPHEDEHDPHFEPVIKLTETVDVHTGEEDEEVCFKVRAKLFRFALESGEWKERGTGDVRLLQHKVSSKIRLVMRREKTYKVCANHLITSDMKLQPNVGSDRSWVWKVPADYSEGSPTAETLAIRFANSDLAGRFKMAFEEAQKSNVALSSKPAPPNESEPAPPKEPELAPPKESESVPTDGNEEEKVETKEEAKEETKE